MVGHSAIRRLAMGGEANKRAATSDEVETMAGLLRDGLEAGGLGFSSSWARTHNDADGQMVPSRYASTAELMRAVPGHRRARRDLAGVPADGRARSSRGPRSSWPTCPSRRSGRSTGTSSSSRRPMQPASKTSCRPGMWPASAGGKVIALTIPKISGIRLSFASGFVLDAMPGWETVMGLPRVVQEGDPGRPRCPCGAERRRASAHQPDARAGRLGDASRIFDVVQPPRISDT